MTIFRLYLRSRRAGWATALVAAIALAGWLWSAWYLPDNPAAVIPALVLYPLAAACVIGVSAHSPLGEIERTASLPLPPLRISHLVGLLLVALALLVLASGSWQYDDAEWMLARNLAGFTGLAFLGARLLGSQLAWAPPVAYGVAAYLASRSTADGERPAAIWAWPILPATNDSAALIALSLIAVGLAAVIVSGTRDAESA